MTEWYKVKTYQNISYISNQDKKYKIVQSIFYQGCGLNKISELVTLQKFGNVLSGKKSYYF